MNTPSSEKRHRLIELLGCLSLATDLATGQPLEHSMRRALLAVWLGEEMGLSEADLSAAYYVSLLGTVGCALEAAQAAPFVDEIEVGEEMVLIDPTDKLESARFLLGRAGRGDPPLKRAGKAVKVMLQGPRQSALVCRDVAMQVGDMLEMGEAVREAVGQCHERWNGKGQPRGLKGEEASLAARIFVVVHDALMLVRLRGRDGAVETIRSRAGNLYDPRIAMLFCDRAFELFGRLEAEPVWDAALAAEPRPQRTVDAMEVDSLAETFGNFVDTRSAFTVLHSRRVADLAASGAARLGLSENDVAAVRRAGYLHDLGRSAIPVAIWDKDAPLTDGERERVRRHPSMTELILARADAFGHIASLSGLHHERLDGSGYRGVSAASLPLTARLLAAADAYESWLEARPYRAALKAHAAAEALQQEVEAGRLDKQAVEALLDAAGHQAPRPKPSPAQTALSERELEVLSLLVRGLSNRQIAEALVVSPKTAGHHVESIYNKIGVSTRVGATLFALQQGLVSA